MTSASSDQEYGRPNNSRESRYLHEFFESACERDPDAIAVIEGTDTFSYREVETRSNRLASFMRDLGVAQNVRVGIVLPRSINTYVSLIAVGKAGATFVPIDPAAPADRVLYIVEDAGVEVVISLSEMTSVSLVEAKRIDLDLFRDQIEEYPDQRPQLDPWEDEADPLAYVMYTSGSSGRPKGVMVAQSSICNFLDVVPDVYDIRPCDRVYQGMTISFDFSIEEIWPTFSRGATVIVGPNDSRRLGGELCEFLEHNEVTVLYCVPTLLATLPDDLPHLRSILVGGEACPQELVERWAPGRRMLNTYGPTEATVTCTWGELKPGRPVTIGKPLPTYSAVLVGDDFNEVPLGEIGEICIGGVGVAKGYVGRPDLTAEKFVRCDSVGFAEGGSAVLYRTGDLGQLNADGEIVYCGRADAEVKVRGHRVDLGEIESVLMQDAEIAEAVVAHMNVAKEGGPEQKELAAFIVLADRPAPNDWESQDDSRAQDPEVAIRLYESMRDRLPSYMIVSFIETLEKLPVMPSGKVDRRLLPTPTVDRIMGSGMVIKPDTEAEKLLSKLWAAELGVSEADLSVEADFFADLAGHSMLAAKLVSAIRSEGTFPYIALRDVYEAPSIRAMAAWATHSVAQETDAADHREPPRRATNTEVAAAGSFQAAAIYLLMLSITLPLAYVYTKNDGAISLELLEELLFAILATYLNVRWVLPLLLGKLLVIGIKPGRYKLWGLTYLRIWAVNLLLSMSPLPLLSGSPIGVWYLRALGARIGSRTTIATSAITLPAFLEIGDDSTLGYGVSLHPWRVEGGWVIVAPIRVGADAFVGAQVVLDPGVTVRRGAAIAEQTVLSTGQHVPSYARMSGSPAVCVDRLSTALEDSIAVEPDRRPWGVGTITAALAGVVVLELAGIGMIVPAIVLVWGSLLSWGILAGLTATLLSGPVFVVTVCLVVACGKRLVLPELKPGVYPLRSIFGVRKWAADKLIEFSLLYTNSLYATLYTVPWLRILGAKMGQRSEVSTAAHLDPDLLEVGEESFVADMVSLGASTFVGGRLVCATTTVGKRSFLGNAAVVPAGSTVGDHALIGVGTVPPEGGASEGSSWLGSPPIHLPARQDSGDYSDSVLFRPSRSDVRHRLVIEFFRASLPASLIAVSFYIFLWALSVISRGQGLLLPALTSPVIMLFVGLLVICFCVLAKRNMVGSYVPRIEPLWSRFVRRSEFVTGLFESAAVPAGIGLVVGTPMLPVVLRWFGVTVGKRVWIGTTYFTEFDLVTLGDDSAIGNEVSLQTHLFEDRVMKMSTLVIEPGATLGTRSIVLYDTVVGTGAELGSLSLLMKGEQLPRMTTWTGIPAQRSTGLVSDSQLFTFTAQEPESAEFKSGTILSTLGA